MNDWAFAADLHLRNWKAFGGPMVAGVNDRAQRILATLAASAHGAVAKGITRYCICGDIFDQHNPSPQLVSALGETMKNIPDLQWFLIVGNHDASSEAPGDHALAPLRLAPNVHVIDTPTVVEDVLLLPFRKARVSDWLETELEHGKRRGAKFLAAHFGLITDQTPKFLTSAPDAVVHSWLDGTLRKLGYEHAFLGNWHNYDRRGRVTQMGTIAPHCFDEFVGIVAWLSRGNAIASVCTLDDHVDPSPGFATVDWSKHQDATKADPENYDGSFYVRWKNVPREKVPEARQQLGDLLRNGIIRGYEVHVVDRQASALSPVFVGLASTTRKSVIKSYINRTYRAESDEVRDNIELRLKGYGVL